MFWIHESGTYSEELIFARYKNNHIVKIGESPNIISPILTFDYMLIFGAFLNSALHQRVFQ